MLTEYSKGTHRPTGRRTMKTMASLKGRALVSSSFIICRAERRGASAGGHYVRVGTIGAAGLRQAALRLPEGGRNAASHTAYVLHHAGALHAAR